MLRKTIAPPHRNVIFFKRHHLRKLHRIQRRTNTGEKSKKREKEKLHNRPRLPVIQKPSKASLTSETVTTFRPLSHSQASLEKPVNHRLSSQQMIRKVGHLLTTQLLHNLLQLTLEHNHRMITALFPERAHSIHEGTPHKGKVRPARERGRHIWPRPDSTIDHHRCAVAKFFGKMSQRLNRRLPNIQLTATVIGCLLYTSPSPRDQRGSRMPSSA